MIFTNYRYQCEKIENVKINHLSILELLVTHIHYRGCHIFYYYYYFAYAFSLQILFWICFPFFHITISPMYLRIWRFFSLTFLDINWIFFKTTKTIEVPIQHNQNEFFNNDFIVFAFSIILIQNLTQSLIKTFRSEM